MSERRTPMVSSQILYRTLYEFGSGIRQDLTENEAALTIFHQRTRKHDGLSLAIRPEMQLEPPTVPAVGTIGDYIDFFPVQQSKLKRQFFGATMLRPFRISREAGSSLIQLNVTVNTTGLSSNVTRQGFAEGSIANDILDSPAKQLAIFVGAEGDPFVARTMDLFAVALGIIQITNLQNELNGEPESFDYPDNLGVAYLEHLQTYGRRPTMLQDTDCITLTGVVQQAERDIRADLQSPRENQP